MQPGSYPLSSDPERRGHQNEYTNGLILSRLTIREEKPASPFTGMHLNDDAEASVVGISKDLLSDFHLVKLRSLTAE